MTNTPDSTDTYKPYRVVNGGGKDIFMWTRHVPVEEEAVKQLQELSQLPFIHRHIAAMPDVHYGIGATVGSVIASVGAVIPAAVGVDIGCGMIACRTSLTADQLPDSLAALRTEIESMVPVGFADHASREYGNRIGAEVNGVFHNHYLQMKTELETILTASPTLSTMMGDVHERALRQIGTLGGGNHFIELCLDENNDVWIMLHSGSRGIGNIIGRYFIEAAKEDMLAKGLSLPNRDIAYLEEGSKHYPLYLQAVAWAQDYARRNRDAMLQVVIEAMRRHLPEFILTKEAIQCHHNYISHETHYGEQVVVTRKGAVAAHRDVLGIIPGSMGAKSFIVRGLGNQESFCSCSHGAGRRMSRGAAKRVITLEQHVEATAGVECRKDEGVLDESPLAYKSIDDVMRSQEDLVEIVHTLKQVLCVKG